jgi:hypothetical protein
MDRKLIVLMIHLRYESSLNPKSIVKTIAIQNTFCSLFRLQSMCCNRERRDQSIEGRLYITKGRKIKVTSSDGLQRHHSVEKASEKMDYCLAVRVAKAVCRCY